MLSFVYHGGACGNDASVTSAANDADAAGDACSLSVNGHDDIHRPNIILSSARLVLM